jgi:hypothetical protein
MKPAGKPLGDWRDIADAINAERLNQGLTGIAGERSALRVKASKAFLQLSDEVDWDEWSRRTGFGYIIEGQF